MEDDSRKGKAFDLAREVWRRRRVLALLVFAVPGAALTTLSLCLPNVYRSTATVLVNRRQVGAAFGRSAVTSPLEVRLDLIKQELLSRSRLDALITHFGLYRNLRTRLSPEQIIERARRDIQLTVKGVEQMGIIGDPGSTMALAISYRGSNPATVARVANMLASSYVEENVRVRAQQAAGAAAFLKAQLQETKRELDEQERRIGEYKTRYTGVPQQIADSLTAVQQLNAQLRLNTDNQTRVAWRREALQRELAEARTLSTADEPRPSDTPAAHLARLKQELLELRTHFSEKYPDVIRVKAEIAALERQLPAPASDGDGASDLAPPPNPLVLRAQDALRHVDAEMQALKEEEKRLRAAIAAYQARADDTPRREREFEKLSRDYLTTQAHYQSLLKRSEEAQLAEDMARQRTGQVRIWDPAVAADKPTAPNRLHLVLTSLVLALGMAAGAIVLAEHVDTSFHSIDDLRMFALGAVVGIPQIVTPADARARRFRVWRNSVAAALVLVLVIGASYLVAIGNERLAWLVAEGAS